MQSENQQQAADQVSISNSIGSLRFLGAIDWREFVETMSVVEQMLREDPGGVYGRMDFATRDRYRHVVEKIAKRSPLTEGEVARKAIAAGREAQRPRTAGRSHGACRVLPDRQGACRSSNGQRRCALAVLEALAAHAGRFPLSSIWADPSADGVLRRRPWCEGACRRVAGLAARACSALSRLLCASQLAVALVNWLATLLVTPQPLPRMDFSEGIPPESRTLVVVPTMLTSPRDIEDLVEALEVRFLANRDDNLHFGLLTDFRDATEETMPEDEPLLRLAREGIEELNEKYRGERSDAFFLFHRPRRGIPGSGSGWATSASAASWRS